MNLFVFLFGAFVVGVTGQIQTYIGGGNYVSNIRKIPYMLSLRQNDTHICGAVFIKSRWALTTVDCVRDIKTGLVKSKLSIRAGSVNIKEGGDVFRVYGFRFHPEYNQATGEYNFVLLKLMGVVPDWLKSPILPPCWTEPTPYDIAETYGWGKDNEYGKFNDNLLKGEMYIMPRSSCNSIPVDYRIEQTSSAKFICAASFGVYTCTGDEGGPLVVNDVLVGITTYRKGCADPDNPSVFGNIGDYNVRRWIDITVN